MATRPRSRSGGPTHADRTGPRPTVRPLDSGAARLLLEGVARALSSVALLVARTFHLFPIRLAIAIVTVPLVLVLSFALVFRSANQEVTYPGVSVAGHPLGGLDANAARATVRQAVAERLGAEVVLRAGDQTWRRSLASLGVGADDHSIDQWLDDAWAIGHRSTWRDWWADQVRLLRHGIDVPGTFTVDHARARATLDVIARAVERDPVDAEVSLAPVGDRFEVHLTPAKAGLRVDVDGTIELISAYARRPNPGSIEVALIVNRAAIDADDLRAATTGASALVDDPIELVDPADPSRRLVLDPRAAHAMLDLRRDTAGGIEARFDPVALRAWVEAVSREAARPATNPHLTRVDGRIQFQVGSVGRAISVEATARRIEAALPTARHDVPMAFVPDPPWVPAVAMEQAFLQLEEATSAPLALVLPADGGRPGRVVVASSETIRAWIALPDAQAIPRDTARMPVASRPRLEWGIDRAALERFVSREILPVVDAAPVNARIAVIARSGPPTPSGPAMVPTPTMASDPVGFALARLSWTATPLGTRTPSIGAATAIAQGTALAALTVTATPRASASPVALATSSEALPRIGSSTPGATPASITPAQLTAAPTSMPGSPPSLDGQTLPQFAAVVVPGRPGRGIDVEVLARVIDVRLHEGLPPLQPILAVPPPSVPGQSGSAGTPAAPGATITRTPTATPSATATPTPSATATASPTSTATRATSPEPGGVLGTPPDPARMGATPSAGAAMTTFDPLTAVTGMRAVVIPIIDRQPVVGLDALEGAARQATVLVRAPILVEWSDREWVIDANDLVDLLRFGPGAVTGTVAYLSRDGLIATADRIARDAVRLADAPVDEAGDVLSVDVPRTAAAIWSAANGDGAARRAEVAWIEDEPTPVRAASTPASGSGKPAETRTPVRNPRTQVDGAATAIPGTPSPTVVGLP